MSAQQIFFTIGIVYFGFWLLVGLGFLVFLLIFIRQMKKKFSKIESKLGIAKVLIDLAQSSFIRKTALFIGGMSFVGKTITSLLPGRDKDKT